MRNHAGQRKTQARACPESLLDECEHALFVEASASQVGVLGKRQLELTAGKLQVLLGGERLGWLGRQVSELAHHFKLGDVNVYCEFNAGKLLSAVVDAGHGLPTSLRGLLSSSHELMLVG